MIKQLFLDIVRELPGTLTGWYLLMLLFFAYFVLARIWYHVVTSRRTHRTITDRCLASCAETGKCYTEFLMAASVAFGAALYFGTHHSHYFLGQNLDFKDWHTHAFLVSAAVMCTAPLYALMWGFISVLCPEGQARDRHLLRFAGFVCRITRLALLVRNCKNFLDMMTHRNSFWLNN